jgi:hypothetical protein
VPLEVTIPSLSADSAADYKAATSLNSDTELRRHSYTSALDSNTVGRASNNNITMFRAAAAAAIQQNVEAELLADSLVNEIKVSEK